MSNQKSILMLCGGGPAPGINSVINTVAKAFLKDGYRVLGLHEGFKGIFSRGGSTLVMSGFKPKDEKLNTDLFINNNVKLLVSIGGNDTASTANRFTGCLKNFTCDDHGHPELGIVSKAHIFNMLLQQKLKELGIDFKSRPVELGYELRCCRPIGFDLTLCTLLGLGVRKLFDEGKSGCMVTANSRGEVTPLFLSEIQDNDGKIAPRLVEIDSEFATLCFQNLYYLYEGDYEAAKR